MGFAQFSTFWKGHVRSTQSQTFLTNPLRKSNRTLTSMLPFSQEAQWHLGVPAARASRQGVGAAVLSWDPFCLFWHISRFTAYGCGSKIG